MQTIEEKICGKLTAMTLSLDNTLDNCEVIKAFMAFTLNLQQDNTSGV